MSLFILVEEHQASQKLVINLFYRRDNLKCDSRCSRGGHPYSGYVPSAPRDNKVYIYIYTRGLETQTPLYRSAARNRDENSGRACHRHEWTADRTICSTRWILRTSYLTAIYPIDTLTVCAKWAATLENSSASENYNFIVHQIFSPNFPVLLFRNKK